MNGVIDRGERFLTLPLRLLHAVGYTVNTLVIVLCWHICIGCGFLLYVECNRTFLRFGDLLRIAYLPHPSRPEASLIRTSLRRLRPLASYIYINVRLSAPLFQYSASASLCEFTHQKGRLS